MIARFIDGLRLQLQNALQQFNPSSISEAQQRAAAMEVQIRSSWTSGSSRPRGQQVSSIDTTTSADAQGTRLNESKTGNTTESIAASRPQRTNALRCYSCGERGHIKTACPKQQRRGLVIQDNDDSGPIFDESASEPEDTEDAIPGDTGVNLVLCRCCLLPRASQESWLRSNLFRSTCTIQGKVCKMIIDFGSCSNVISRAAVSRTWTQDQTTSVNL